MMGSFGGKVINLYATQVYGPEWQSTSMLEPAGAPGITEIIDV